jgi:hypothetical protein
VAKDQTRRLARPKAAWTYGGFSRATLYRLIAQKKIRVFRQSPRITLVDLDSIDTLQNNLPETTCQR